MQKLFLIVIVLVSAAACSKKIKEKIGVVTPGPDEYRVQRSKSLEVPPHYELPTPGNQYEPNSRVDSFSNLNEGEKELMKEIESK